MIKKIITTSMCICALTSQAHAGAMGPVSSVPYRVTPFVSGEGSVTWNSIQSIHVFGHEPSQTHQRWGGRGALGLLFPYTDRLQFSAEGGWGYYGRVGMSNSAVSSNGLFSLNVSNTSNLYGFDLLAGALYSFNQVDIFLKAGAMAENRAFDSHRTLTGPSTSSIINLNNTQTNVFPEIKVGGIYNFNERLGLSLAYMYVFGNDSLNSTVPDGASPPTNTNLNADIGNPSLQSFMFGLVYKFA